MQVRPVQRSKSPGYPTRRELLADEGELERHLPLNWRSGPKFLSAVTLLVAANLTGCGHSPTPPPDASLDSLLSELPPPIVMEASDWIRSIYDDGSGWGTLGCVAIMPADFLPEDEAIQSLKLE